jgi:hypothetical protein
MIAKVFFFMKLFFDTLYIYIHASVSVGSYSRARQCPGTRTEKVQKVRLDML